MTDKTTKDRQRKYRERQAKEGRSEVRGIYARPENHAKIKQYAKKLEESG